MSFLTPEFFNSVVLVVIAVGSLFAARRLYSDFKRGPRWSALSTVPAQHDPNAPEPLSDANRSELK